MRAIRTSQGLEKGVDISDVEEAEQGVIVKCIFAVCQAVENLF